jgi:acyl-CoA thioester hydrolase
MTDPPPFNVSLVRVSMHHTDLLGGVYHGTFFGLFDQSRTEVFRALGYSYRDMVEGEGRLTVIVRAACDYKRPALMDDLLAISVQVASLGRARMGFRYEVRQAERGDLLAIGEHVFAFLDATTRRPTSVPPRLARLIRETPGFLIDGA